MKAVNLRIEPFESLKILGFEMRLAVNEHGSVIFTGCIPPEKEEAYLKMTLGDTWCPVYATAESGVEQIVFYGVITKLLLRSEEGIKYITAELKTGSYLLDQDSHIRSFQNGSSTYQNCMNTILKGYGNHGILMTIGEKVPIQDFLLQYMETDWGFAKRLASHHQSVLFPEYRTPGVRLYFGMPEPSDLWEVEEENYRAEKRMEESAGTKSRERLLSEWNTVCYQVESREFHDMGKRVLLNGQALRIEAVRSTWERGEWMHTYTLRPGHAFLTKKAYNPTLTGTSLEGLIAAVKGDRVKVKLLEDETGAAGERWFPYSTVYSSPDGSGWYCMPEPGDSIRLFLPKENEKHAYVVSAVHKESGDRASRSNPDFKTIKTKDGKEVTFEPGRIFLTNHKGMSIEINDEEGIKIESEKGVSISSKSVLGILSKEENLGFLSAGEIELNQGETQIQLGKNAVLSGSKINLQ